MMERNNIFLTSVGLVALVALFQLPNGWTQQADRGNTSWEYKVLSLGNFHSESASEMATALNKAGLDRWEVAGTTTQMHHGDSSGNFVILKRPRQ